jgi:Asp-tRNA(Asn)/Glu-tRNA(Gln) amidotransferase B subunit
MKEPILMEDQTEIFCRDSIENFPKQVREYLAGQPVLGFFVKDVMQESAGACNPAKVREVLLRLLEEKRPK